MVLKLSRYVLSFSTENFYLSLNTAFHRPIYTNRHLFAFPSASTSAACVSNPRASDATMLILIHTASCICIFLCPYIQGQELFDEMLEMNSVL